MGYRLLEKQLRAIQELTQQPTDSLELLWLPGMVQVVIWDKRGKHETYKIDEDGNSEQVM